MATTTASDDVRTEPPTMDYGTHQRQYERFLHLTKWFIIHAAVLIPGLYFLIIAGQGLTGTVLVLIGLAILTYGIMSTGGIGHDFEDTVDSVRHHRRTRD